MFRAWLRGSLSLVHLHVLTILEVDGPLSMGRLADALDVSVASATGIVDRMEQRGLVERRHGRERSAGGRWSTPTAAGAGGLRRDRRDRRAHLAKVLARLTDDELIALLVGLRALRKARPRWPRRTRRRPPRSDSRARPAADARRPGGTAR